MNRHLKPSKKIIYERAYKKLENSQLDAYYSNWFYKNINGKKIFISHIICENLVKVANYSEVLRLMKLNTKEVADSDTSLNKDNSIIYTILELSKGINFFPDMKMINEATNNNESITYITTGGIVTIIGMEYAKALSSIQYANNTFAKQERLDIVFDFNQALEKINEYIATDFNV